jgi:hypothetical protein
MAEGTGTTMNYHYGGGPVRRISPFVMDDDDPGSCGLPRRIPGVPPRLRVGRRPASSCFSAPFFRQVLLWEWANGIGMDLQASSHTA